MFFARREAFSATHLHIPAAFLNPNEARNCSPDPNDRTAKTSNENIIIYTSSTD